MKILTSFVLLVAFFVSSNLFAATWIGICNDGQNIQFNQTVGGNGFLYMKVSDNRGRMSTYQMARLEQTFFNGVAICGTVLENGITNWGDPITQICMNKDRGLIYVKYRHPYQNQREKSGTFCQANVRVSN